MITETRGKKSKLTLQMQDEIIHSRLSPAKLAKLYGVSYGPIYRILRERKVSK